jgi:hypothetical protein
MTRKKRPRVEDLVFAAVGVARRDLVYVLAHPAEPAGREEGEPLAYLLQRTGEKWDVLPTQWEAALLAIQHDPIIVRAIGVGGEVVRIAGSAIAREYVDRGPDGPAATGWLRGARAIGPYVFVVGMGRQAYLHDDSGWRRIDQAIRASGTMGAPPGAAPQPLGLEAVDGTSERDVYAVGLQGEMFRYDGARFRKLDSPTNLALRDVRAVDPERCFVCGTAGILLRGAGDDFEAVDHRSTEANLYSLEWFREQLYVASLKAVYRLAGDALVPVDLGIPGLTAGNLHAADGVLWSCGARHLAFTTDGVAWTPVTVAL